MGEVQTSGIHAAPGADAVPVFGGYGGEGAFTIVSGNAHIGEQGYRITYGNSYIQAVTWEPDGGEQGYRITYGNSYIQAVTWEPDGLDGLGAPRFKPHAEGFITYSESTDPANPHWSDFTRAYSAKQWQRLPFTPEEIAAQRISSVRLTQ
jgi:acyl-homoserine-lactone acylase